MSTVVIEISAPTPAQQAAIERLPRRFIEALRPEMDRTNEIIVGHIQAARLSRRGPETLGVRTNRLRLSARPSKAVIEGDSVNATLGSNVRYAAPHEFSFAGTVSVKAHTRKSKPRIATHTHNFTEFNWRSGKMVARVRRVKVKAKPTEMQVRAHSRKMNIPARAPFQRGIEDKVSLYDQAVGRAVDRAIASEGGATP
jgi:hypothetical protein